MAALLAVLALLLLGLWTQRKPIARDFVDRALRARGVPARYTITDLGFGRQRLTGLVIGDPAAPDLTADMVELRIRYGFGWPGVRSITARGVRLRASVIDGTVSAGSIDRLLPRASGAPFTLPNLHVDIADALIHLQTPAGAVALTVAGQGNLADGFAGRLAAAAPRLAQGGCSALRPTASFAVRIAGRRPHLSGPIAAAGLACGDLAVDRPHAVVTAGLAEALTPLTLSARFAAGGVTTGAVRTGGIAVQADYDATDPRDRHGVVQVAATTVAARAATARRIRFDGRYRIGAAVRLLRETARPLGVSGTAAIDGGTLASSKLRPVDDAVRSLAGTPLAPLTNALGDAARRAGRDFTASANLAFDGDVVDRIGGRMALRGDASLSRLALDSRSGGRLRFAARGGAGVRVAGGAARLDGIVTLAGGGFPAMRIALRQAAPNAPLAGEATISPYRAGAARLALAPVRFTRAAAGTLRFATTVTLDGPLGDGSVTGLAVPIDGRFGTALTVNAACVPLRFSALAIAGVHLGVTRLPLCPLGGAMLRVAGGRVSGGFVVPRPRLAGRVGAQPLTINANGLRVMLDRPGFAADALAVRLGGEAGTRLDVARLDGRIVQGGVGGQFAGAAGRIANVPLLLSRGEGAWRLASTRLSLAGQLAVADADADPRFVPLVVPDMRLDLAAGVIHAGGMLREPKSGVAISEVAITHSLRTARGGAVLDVPGITFGPAFQPEVLTRLTLGVVANVAGSVSGQARIDWSPDGVKSSGDFATDGTDLAAVFGPVTGISTRIHFSDLLGLTTPPGQIVTVAAFNPGIAVEGGVIGYQLLPGRKVAVGGGKWPFFGGALILEPTILDFGQPVERRMTFRVEGLDAAKFIERFDFRNIAATGLFDGVLPMIFDQTGGRIVEGRLAVRPGGGTLAYVGELTNRDLGMFGKLAFDALKSMRYDNLSIELDGALDSEIVSRIRFTGINESPVPAKKAKGLLRNLTGLPFKFNIVVHAPFRGLASAAGAFVNPGGLIRGAATPPLVQPPLTEDKR